MERWMYALEHNYIEQLKAIHEDLSCKGISPLSLRELLRTQEEKAFGILLRNIPEMLMPAVMQFAAEHSLPITVACKHRYTEETLHLLQKSSEVTLLPEASYLQELVRQNNGEPVRAQAIFWESERTVELSELLRACHTRVVLSGNSNLLSEVSADGFYCIPVILAGETHVAKASFELPLDKTPLLPFPLAPRLAMLKSTAEILSCRFIRRYHASENRYELLGELPMLREIKREIPVEPVKAFENALHQGFGILLSQDNKERFFLYGIHGDTGCFLTMDDNWHQQLLSRHGLMRILQNESTVTLLQRNDRELAPDPQLLDTAFMEDKSPGQELLSERTAAITYLNRFSRGEVTTDISSFSTFVGERILISGALKWFAEAGSLYVDHLEAHLALIEKHIMPIFNALRQEKVDFTPSCRLQWGDVLQRILNSEEICLRQYLDEKQRMATYLRWAEELQKSHK